MFINVYKVLEKIFLESKILKRMCEIDNKILKNSWYIECIVKMISNVFVKFICYFINKKYIDFISLGF